MSVQEIEKYNEAIDFILTSDYFDRSRSAAIGILNNKEIENLEEWEWHTSLLLVKLFRIIDDPKYYRDKHNCKSTIRRTSSVVLNS